MPHPKDETSFLKDSLDYRSAKAELASTAGKMTYMTNA